MRWVFVTFFLVFVTWHSWQFAPLHVLSFGFFTLGPSTHDSRNAPSWLRHLPHSLVYSKSLTRKPFSDAKHPFNVVAIAGGVVGSIPALVLIPGVIWFFIRGNRRNKNEPLILKAKRVSSMV